MSAAPKSPFVTVLAWMFIGLAGGSTLLSILQNVVMWFVFPAMGMDPTLLPVPERVPLGFMFRYLKEWLLFVLLLSLAAFGASVALLLRKSWARIAFVGLMVFGIAWNLAALVLVGVFIASLPPLPAITPASIEQGFNTMIYLIVGFSVLMTVGFSVLFGWIAMRLMSPEIRAEFS